MTQRDESRLAEEDSERPAAPAAANAPIGVTVMFGVLLFIVSYDSFRNVQASYDRTYARTNFADLTVTGGDPDKIARGGP